MSQTPLDNIIPLWYNKNIPFWDIDRKIFYLSLSVNVHSIHADNLGTEWRFLCFVQTVEKKFQAEVGFAQYVVLICTPTRKTAISVNL